MKLLSSIELKVYTVFIIVYPDLAVVLSLITGRAGDQSFGTVSGLNILLGLIKLGFCLTLFFPF